MMFHNGLRVPLSVTPSVYNAQCKLTTAASVVQ